MDKFVLQAAVPCCSHLGTKAFIHSALFSLNLLQKTLRLPESLLFSAFTSKLKVLEADLITSTFCLVLFFKLLVIFCKRCYFLCRFCRCLLARTPLNMFFFYLNLYMIKKIIIKLCRKN